MRPEAWKSYFLRRLERVEDDFVGSDFVSVLTGSGSSGAGGGVVSMVHPIHPEITSTNSTNRRTGIPIAHCCQPEFSSPGMKGEKNAARYAMNITTENRKITKP